MRKHWSRSDLKEKTTSFTKPRHPPWLKGKEIGLYYRNLQRQNSDNAPAPKEKRKKRDVTGLESSLKIPSTVVKELLNNLRAIADIATNNNIAIAPLKTKFTTDFKKENKTQHTNPNDVDNYKINNSNSKDINVQPGTSKAPDFIPVNQHRSEFDSTVRQLSLRGGGDFKYGYKDIITGTFDEKLEECLSKGIKISIVNEETKHYNRKYQREYEKTINSSAYKKFLQFRKKLPTFIKSSELLDVILDNQVVVISGETGCGKSTQVPQILLDHAIYGGRGGNVKILVTQPRRIAAISLATRVADERAEHVGKSVGYAVRLERRDPRPRGSILFCTTGILLTDLEVNQGLTDFSHIILDEVHERDCHIDLALCMLKQVLKRRSDLKLILMSATLDAETLSAYFDNCKMMHIEGLAYPVKDVYLEDVLKLTKFRLEPLKSNKRNKFPRQEKQLMMKEMKYRSEVGEWLNSIKKKVDRHVYNTLLDFRIEELNLELILDLLLYICTQDPGAILVFLPGIGEITKLIRLMNESLFPKSNFDIYPLHSKLASIEQRKIFERPPKSVRKIIIATNIAETSITIDDIVYVVDCAKMKINGLNVEDNISTLKVEWISKANLRQRRGRAGRCQPGICYHLCTTFRAESLEERTLPELQRSNLLEPVLSIKRLRLGKAADALKLVPSQPARKTVEMAVKHLQRCGALDENETLTPLGWHLARLPVHPAAGKLLVLGALFGCLDRAASVAAVWSFKDPFNLVIGKENEVDQAKRHLALGEASDHVAISEAVIQWEDIPTYSNKRKFAYEHFISMQTTELLSDMKRQLGNNLKQMGFLASGDVKSPYENRNGDNLSLFKAVIAASLYPNVANVKWSGLHKRRMTAINIKAATPEDGMVRIHPSSVMAPKFGSANPCDNPGANYLVYWLKQKSSELFLIDVTLVFTLPLLFFGEFNVTESERNADKYIIPISSRQVSLNKVEAKLLLELRSLLDQVLAAKVTNSNMHAVQHNEFEETVLKAVINLITAEDEGLEDNFCTDTDSETDSQRRHK